MNFSFYVISWVGELHICLAHNKLCKKKSKYVADAPEEFILGGMHLYIQKVHTFPHSHNPILTVIMV